MIKVNGEKLSFFTFPDRTSQVWRLNDKILSADVVNVEWDFTGENEFMHLAQLKTLLDVHNRVANLDIKYLPYGRQDKEVSNTKTFALRTFANLINGLNFNTVTILDPHSTIALDLIKNSKAVYPKDTLNTILSDTKSDMVCYPDKGAVSKYLELYSVPAHSYGEKVRNQDTGHIESYQLVGDPKGRTVLIVDDICDGGATFVLLAKALFDAGAKEVNLFVTHGIFSKGLVGMKLAGINRIFTHKAEYFKRNDNEYAYKLYEGES